VVTVPGRGRTLLLSIKHAQRGEMRAALAHMQPHALHELQRLLDAVLAGMVRMAEQHEHSAAERT